MPGVLFFLHDSMPIIFSELFSDSVIFFHAIFFSMLFNCSFQYGFEFFSLSVHILISIRNSRNVSQ